MNDYVIETKQVTKAYDSFFALDHVDLHVRKGCVYGLIGDNGAGKSTLLKILAGLCFATEGEIRLFGKYTQKEQMHARRQMGCMIEQPGFFPNMTVEQTLKYYGIQKGVPDRKKADEMMELVGLEKKRKNKCRTLSLGQKQRLGLAIAMLGEPRLLLLDEPVNGLDPSGMMELRGVFRRLNEERNITILLSSHILTELQQIATAYGFLAKGRLIEEISASALQEKCSDCIELTVSDPEAYAALFAKTFPKETYHVLAGKQIRISKPQADPEIYSKLAYENRIYIKGMQVICTSLEDYYMELKERGAKPC